MLNCEILNTSAYICKNNNFKTKLQLVPKKRNSPANISHLVQPFSDSKDPGSSLVPEIRFSKFSVVFVFSNGLSSSEGKPERMEIFRNLKLSFKSLKFESSQIL